MRIHSLDNLAPLNHPTVVVVNSDCFDVDLSGFESGSIFFRTVPEPLPEELPLVVVNPTPVLVETLHANGAFRGQRPIELWADSTGFSNLVLCLSGFDHLAVAGASPGTNWFKVGVQPGTVTDRLGEDLFVGLKASLLLASVKEDPETHVAVDADVGSTSLKSNLMQMAARIARPIKTYLPIPVIHMLYKILRVLQ
ncbi:hypothetical protein [Corynebacterium coyleae]|uniref:hypothetical protein n=1 Tax=Corynebacterium coyleae TaxID=53374 RepID=UPI00254B51F8|nr:hypothetical protein [Corynebacterium coyleae]MDK8800613.1 hypothetical protein [Corynebacterium coyleae]